jgi:hypothetical protein
MTKISYNGYRFPHEIVQEASGSPGGGKSYEIVNVAFQ